MTGSAVPRRILGRLLKQLRERSGVPTAAAARAIEVSPQTLWRIESGQPGVKLKEMYISVLCEMYGASEKETAALIGLVDEANKPGWWQSFGNTVPADFDLYIGLEEVAKSQITFHQSLLPGLLQTTEYRRAVLWVEFPNYPSEMIERYIEVHTRRVARLEDDTNRLELRVLLDEAVLHRVVGGAAVMAGQLRHLIAAIERPQTSIRVVPQRSGNHLGIIAGSFVLMEFPLHPTSRLTEPPVVYVQGYTGALYLDQDSEIRQYRDALIQIRRVALDENRSRELLLKMAREYEREC